VRRGRPTFDPNREMERLVAMGDVLRDAIQRAEEDILRGAQAMAFCRHTLGNVGEKSVVILHRWWSGRSTRIDEIMKKELEGQCGTYRDCVWDFLDELGLIRRDADRYGYEAIHVNDHAMEVLDVAFREGGVALRKFGTLVGLVFRAGLRMSGKSTHVGSRWFYVVGRTIEEADPERPGDRTGVYRRISKERFFRIARRDGQDVDLGAKMLYEDRERPKEYRLFRELTSSSGGIILAISRDAVLARERMLERWNELYRTA